MFNLIFDGFLKHPSQDNPCYRKVLSYSFFRYQKNNSDEKVLHALQDLKSNFDLQKPYKLDGYLGLYPIEIAENEGVGYLIVDASRPVYPLVIYPQSNSTFNLMPNQPRYSALRVALDDVYRNREKLIGVFKKHAQWNLELETELERLFKYKNDRLYTKNIKKRNG